MTLCALRATTVLSRDCRADFVRRLAKNVMSHSCDGPGVTAPLQTNIVLPALLQKLVGEFVLNLGWETWPDFCGIFLNPQNKGSKTSGQISEHFS